MAKILFDITLMRVGCVNLQAIYGGDRRLTMLLSPYWETSMTPNMKLYEITEEQKPLLIRKIEAHHKKP